MKRKLKTLLLFFCLLAFTVTAFRFAPGFISVSTNANGKELPICSVATQKPWLSLTFDTAQENQAIDEILAVLKEHKVHATFFVTGKWVEEFPEDVKKILAQGHELGNHSENHLHMKDLSQEEITKELLQVHKRVKDLTNYDLFLFRPPYGEYNDKLIKNAMDNGYYPIQWNIDSLDWKDYSAQDIARTVCTSSVLGSGSILLFHTQSKYTSGALGVVIEDLEKKGYAFVPVSQLIYKEDYHIDNLGAQISNRS